ncbi:DUF1203 domain-containing protein [Caulobacter sp. ErkDOM-YI]|uniref:DUF1203 domain-containing protein n=1 Tax=unclassified Caulobacter TaxID=2648921 RepID=UPI003AF90BFA
MSFTISGLPVEDFRPLFTLDTEALAERGIIRRVATAKPGFPCRIGLRDAEPGETVLLLNHEHQPADTPYRSSYAIYVSEAAVETWSGRDTIPSAMRGRPIALRAFSGDGLLLSAEVAMGEGLEPAVERQLATPGAAYVHAHNAGHGCFVARIDRAEP